MTGVAVKGQGAILAAGLATSGSALNITGASQASPGVLTVTNALSAGAVGVVAGISGMSQLNNRAFTLSPVTGTTATLKGEDTTNDTAYVSGGTLQAYTMTQIANVTGIKGFDGQASEIDTTHLLSSAKEFQLGLQDFGNVTVDVLLINADAGQIGLRKLKASATAAPFTITLADGTVATFMAFVKEFSFDGVKPDGAVTGEITLRVTNAPAWFA